MYKNAPKKVENFSSAACTTSLYEISFGEIISINKVVGGVGQKYEFQI